MSSGGRTKGSTNRSSKSGTTGTTELSTGLSTMDTMDGSVVGSSQGIKEQSDLEQVESLLNSGHDINISIIGNNFYLSPGKSGIRSIIFPTFLRCLNCINHFSKQASVRFFSVNVDPKRHYYHQPLDPLDHRSHQIQNFLLQCGCPKLLGHSRTTFLPPVVIFDYKWWEKCCHNGVTS